MAALLRLESGRLFTSTNVPLVYVQPDWQIHPTDALRKRAMLKGSCHCDAAGWTLNGDPGRVTACNCTLCRRYGALWAYDYEGERAAVHGITATFRRVGKRDPALEIIFCPTCAGVLAWRGLKLETDGRRRMAVNVRLASPDAVANLPIDHFDGLDTFEDLPANGQIVRDVWF